MRTGTRSGSLRWSKRLTVTKLFAKPFLSGGGEMGERIREFDWAKTPLGSPAKWPQNLKSALSIMLESRYQMFVWWGPEFVKFYNDAYRSALGNRHPHALGHRAREVWRDIWDTVGPQAEQVLYENVSTWHENQLLVMERNGFTEETFFSYSYSPIPSDHGGPGGVFCACNETTEQVIGERRLAALRQLASVTASGKSTSQACELAAEALRDYDRDVSFALIYLVDRQDNSASLCAYTGVASGAAAAPKKVNFGETSSSATQYWPFHDVLNGSKITVTDWSSRERLPGGPWPEPTKTAMLLPLQGSQAQPIGFVVLGASPRLRFDDKYEGFFELIAGNISSAITNARAYEEERRRAEQLAALDRAKTAFFSNVSHELRTPLTLMLGPLEDVLSFRHGILPKEVTGSLEVAHRNSLRLLKLVNTLLDFARIEAGRIEAHYEPTDLSTFTTELASVFRSAIEKAGLRLEIDCPPVPEAVFVDREMWEKIVLNLLSNAFKFTFEGEIAVSLRWFGERVELTVRDTGVGIPESDLPKVFERFHRVRGTRSRSHEGTGIGLALVQELAQIHGGEVKVRSRENHGSEFIVSIQTGKEHLPPEHIRTASPTQAGPRSSDFFASESQRLLPESATPVSNAPSQDTGAARPKILLADDNPDMRDYVRRLLSEHYDVEAVSDGSAALEKVRTRHPDLILADVMMPHLDGFGLLRHLRSDEHTRAIPFVMLSARAGEESRLEGLDAGANDYLIKPFSARELIARVQSQLELARLRREGEERIKRVLDSITDGFYLLDDEGRFLDLNAAARKMFGAEGIDANALMGQRWFEKFPEARNQAFNFALEKATRERIPVDTEAYYPPWNRWYFFRCRPLPEGGVATFFQDITERKLAEIALRESEAHLDIVSNTVPALIVYLDRDRRYRSCNRAYLQWFGLRREQVIGRTTRELQGEEIGRKVEPLLARALAGESVSFETEADSRQGKRWVHVIYTPHFNPDGAVVGVVGFASDITDRKRDEEELHKAQAALREHAGLLEGTVADRTAKLRETVSELESFSYSIAHDMRAPLRSMRSFSEILYAEYGDKLGREAGDYLRRICASAGRLDRLIQDVLDYSKVLRGEMPLENLATEALLREIIESYPDFQPPHATVLVQTPLPNVRANPAALTQVISNLLANAVKFVAPGDKPRVIIRGEETGSTVRLWFEDNGIGIAPHHLDRIFKLFGRLHSEAQYEGTGIGLVIIRKAVDRMGGRVGVESVPGQGSRFWVELPSA